ASKIDPKDPLSGLEVGDRPDPEVPDGWTTVTVKAASLNHHDLWSLRGVGLGEDKLPMILGCDAAGLDEDGNEVIVHAVISSDGWRGDETFDPRRSLLSERYQGALAEKVAVPRANVLPKPPELSFEQAACLPTAWLTAYRVFESGARLPERVDAVFETTGKATWGHSIRSLRPGGTVVVSGATTGDPAPAELTRIFFLQLSVVGSTMGTREELERLMRLCVDRDVRPVIHSTLPIADARQGFEAMLAGDVV